MNTVIFQDDLEGYEAWRRAWQRRPHAEVKEGKVETHEKTGVQSMPVIARAPGFRPAMAIVIMNPKPEEVPVEVEPPQPEASVTEQVAAAVEAQVS